MEAEVTTESASGSWTWQSGDSAVGRCDRVHSAGQLVADRGKAQRKCQVQQARGLPLLCRDALSFPKTLPASRLRLELPPALRSR